jgi:hypothetical protein
MEWPIAAFSAGLALPLAVVGLGRVSPYTKTRRPLLILREFQRDIHCKNVRWFNDMGTPDR